MERLSEKALHQLLRNRGLKATRQRDEIVRALWEAGTHLTVDELYQRVRRENPRIGYATVYRTLRLLAESGWASARRFGERTARFEHRTEGEHHDHLICRGCGKIQEFENDRLEALQERIEHPIGERAQNLINNAIKYSPNEKYLGVKLYRSNGTVKLEVEDHGIGIPRGEQSKIFDKFYRAGDPLVHNKKEADWDFPWCSTSSMRTAARSPWRARRAREADSRLRCRWTRMRVNSGTGGWRRGHAN